MTDLVFINFRTGEPSKNSSYDTHLYKICDENGIKRFCMHALRHTYATRAIVNGKMVKKWYSNGEALKEQNLETIDKSGLSKEM